MEDQSNATSGKHQRAASNAPNDPAAPSSSKRQKTTTTPPSCPAAPFQNEGVLAAMDKLTQLVEHHHQLVQSKLEGMLKDVFNKLEPEVSAAIRKEKKRMKILVRSSTSC